MFAMLESLVNNSNGINIFAILILILEAEALRSKDST